MAGFGIASGVINTIGTIPYLRDVLRGKTKPERASWWVWLALAVIAFYAQVAANATWSLFITGSSVLTIGAIALLSLKYGYGKFRTRDRNSLIIAAIGIGISFMLSSPLIALLVVISVDLVGYWLTVTKTWLAPHTETLISWLASAIAGGLAAIAVGEIELSKLIYPFYWMVCAGVMTLIIFGRRQKASHDVLASK